MTAPDHLLENKGIDYRYSESVVLCFGKFSGFKKLTSLSGCDILFVKSKSICIYVAIKGRKT